MNVKKYEIHIRMLVCKNKCNCMYVWREVKVSSYRKNLSFLEVHEETSPLAYLSLPPWTLRYFPRERPCAARFHSAAASSPRPVP